MDHRADESSVRIGKRHLLRHAVATIAYRGGKALGNAPGHVARFHLKDGSRTPAEICAHRRSPRLGASLAQIAMLRRLAGSPVRGENYFTLDIVHGRVGPEQSAPRRELD